MLGHLLRMAVPVGTRFRAAAAIARRMLAEASLRAEVDAYIARSAGERDENGRRLVVRNEPGDLDQCGRSR
jgi:hypothetical protein